MWVEENYKFNLDRLALKLEGFLDELLEIPVDQMTPEQTMVIPEIARILDYFYEYGTGKIERGRDNGR